MVIQKMELGAPDASGRRSPVVIEGSETTIEVDTVVVSVGVSPNPLIPNSQPDLNTTRWGTLVVNEETLQTSIPDLFAGGDIGMGRRSHSYFSHGRWPKGCQFNGSMGDRYL